MGEMFYRWYFEWLNVPWSTAVYSSSTWKKNHQKLKSFLHSNFSTSPTNDYFATVSNGGQNEWTALFQAKTSASSLKLKDAAPARPALAMPCIVLVPQPITTSLLSAEERWLKPREKQVWEIHQPPNHSLNRNISEAKCGSTRKDGSRLVCAALWGVF